MRNGVRPRLMGSDDWYRRSTWTEAAQAEFFERLKRSRGAFNKAQYLRIQALHLQENKLFADALTLLDILFRDYPDEDSQLTGALKQKAECLWAIGDRNGSFDAYTQGLASQRRRPGMLWQIALSFAERFWDYDKGTYRKVLVEELSQEIERMSLLSAHDKVRYGTLMVKLLGDAADAENWKRLVNDGQRQITLAAMPVAVPKAAPAATGDQPHGKSFFVAEMDAIQGQLRPMLKALGFRSKGRSFSRVTADGLTHVIHFQTGPFDPPGATYVPGLTSNLYGQFTVNVGVYVPEVKEWTIGIRSKSIHEVDCCIRARIGNLDPERRDIWWHIENRPGLIEELRERFESRVLPFLDRYQTRDAILAQRGKPGEWWGGGPARITCAIILNLRGEKDEARKLLDEQERDPNAHASHAQYVRELAVKLGLRESSNS